MTNKLKINCDEATSICDKNQYGEASLWDKIRINMHFIMCKHCKAYSSQNSLITRLIRKQIIPCDNSNHLTREEKEAMEKNITQKLQE